MIRHRYITCAFFVEVKCAVRYYNYTYGLGDSSAPARWYHVVIAKIIQFFIDNVIPPLKNRKKYKVNTYQPTLYNRGSRKLTQLSAIHLILFANQ